MNGGKTRQTNKHVMKATDLLKIFFFKSALLNLGIFKATSCNLMFKRTVPNAEFQLLCNILRRMYLKEIT